jgi:hypothetical protein
MTGIPVDRMLVPDVAPAAPTGATTVTQPLVRGLPMELPLDARDTLVLHVPTGIAAPWRDVDPTTVVADADDERAPAGTLPTPDALARPPARLVLRRDGVFVAGLPLVLGLHRIVPDDGSSSAAIDLTVLDYRLHAGTLCGSGDFGSFVNFAWQRADLAVDTFALPPLHPRVAERFQGQVRSQLGVAPVTEGDGPW